MEATREIYWNVGHGVLIPMYILALAAVGAMAYGLFSAARALAARGKPEDRTGAMPRRIALALRYALMQAKVIRGGGAAGWEHAIFFWSFLILTAGTTLVFIQADFTDLLFGYRFLKGDFYMVFSLALDIAGLAAMAALAGLGVRRFILRPEGLVTVPSDALVHALLFLALATGFGVEGLRMAATELDTNMALAYWSPVGLVVAKFLHGMSQQTLSTAHMVMWWTHFVVCLGFFVSIPYTKLRHIFYIPVSQAADDLGPVGKLATLNLEDESAQQFGAAKAGDLSWKDLFDSGACVKCKRCQDQCPAHRTGKPLSPMKLALDIGAASDDAPLAETVGEDAVWACVTCRACQAICPAGVEHVRKIIAIRRNLVLMEGKLPGPEVQKALEGIETLGNPLGGAPGERAAWAKGLALAEGGEDASVLYFTGCYACYDKRSVKVARAFAAVLGKLGVKAAILGKQEKCCGEPARKLGNEYLYQTVAAENIAAINGAGIKKVVTTCPHCFHTLNKEYRDLGLDGGITVQHYTEFLAPYAGRFARGDGAAVTYHDSCYLGRYNGVLAQPRALLGAIGANVAEMKAHGEYSFCCGGGGGLALAEEKIGKRINSVRAAMAGDTGAGTLASSCPFCLTMLEDGVKTAGLDGRLRPVDLLELLAERI